MKTGDLVRLRCGGPRMTVEDVDSHARIACVWFDSHDRVQRNAFDERLLELAPGAARYEPHRMPT